MSNQDAYITLISSFPASERLFIEKQAPLSRLRLDQRLKALTPDDANTLLSIESLFAWQHYSMDDSDEAIIQRARQVLAQIRQPTLRAIITERLELRTAVAALRLRKEGAVAPISPWGFGRWTKTIEANWADAVFALGTAMPWLHEANNLINNQDPLGFERYILQVTYRQLQRHGARHSFDFEAVVIYVLKWHIFDRWSHSNTEAAARRFEALVQSALGKYADASALGEIK
ncbi:MAG: hypothetical protein OFPII_11490 [Osedax symbiont Rs1]|nr:MAG: hypothetical protein OFPII_11490 [Osedax symbiont Rs1]